MGERRRPAGWGTVRLGSVIVLAGLVGTAEALSATSTPSPSATPRAVSDACADADGDGLLTVTDAVQTLRAVAELPTTCTPFRCDVDGNAAITVSDGILILMRAAGIYAPRAFDCPVPSRERDFSDFASFTLSRRSGLGFCPDIGSVLDAEIERQSDGTYLARLWVADEGPLDHPDCVFSFGEPPCIRRVPVAERALTDDDIEILRDAFRSVVVYEARHPSCAAVAYDYCVLDRFDWDGAVVSNDLCTSAWMPFGDRERLGDALDRLLPASEDVAR